MARERRWIVLTEDGGHVSVGRASDPDDVTLAPIAAALRAQDCGGWLVVMEGDYYRKRPAPTLMQVRALAPARVDWDTAVAAFQTRRTQALSAA